MSVCVVCECETDGQPRGYTVDDEPVHVACVKSAKVPCKHCWLIHVGACG